MPESSNVTVLLESWQSGDEQALQQLSQQVYSELQRLAHIYMRSERSDHTLQPTALVNEAFVKLVQADVSFKNRAHFYALAGRTMRRILVDHARSHRREKRGDGVKPVTLLHSVMQAEQVQTNLLELDDALQDLGKFDKRKAEILELQFFAGLGVREIAETMDVPIRTIEREIQLAKAWLHRELSR